MSHRPRWIAPTALVVGLAVVGITVFALVRTAKGGPAGGPILERLAGTLENVNEGFGRNLRSVRPDIPWVGGWETAEGEETLGGTQTAIEVSNDSGPIRVVPSDGDMVRVRYVKRARTRADLDELEIQVRAEGDTVTARPVRPLVGAPGRFGEVELVVGVPERIRSLTLTTISGEIVVSGITGQMTRVLETTSGPITTDGPGNLTAKTVSGTVRFAFSGDHLEVQSVSGGISGTVETLGSGGARLGSVSGGVDLVVAEGLNAALDLRSVSGTVECSYPVTIRERGRGKLLGTAGSGGAPLTVHTTSGSIHIQG